MDSTTLSSEKSRSPLFAPKIVFRSFDSDILYFVVEFATVGKTAEGKIYHHLWTADEIQSLLREQGLAKPETEE